VDVVVSEDRPEIDSPPYHAFLRLLKTDRFAPIGEVALRNAEDRIAARTLTIYHFRSKQPVSNRVALPLTALGPGFRLEVDLSRPLRGWRDGRSGGPRTTADRDRPGRGGDSG
jgi:hypothetical protein